MTKISDKYQSMLMNSAKSVHSFARKYLKENLAILPPGWQHRFRLMYCNGNLLLTIPEVVDRMPAKKLSWALRQVETSVKSYQKQLVNWESYLGLLARGDQEFLHFR